MSRYLNLRIAAFSASCANTGKSCDFFLLGKKLQSNALKRSTWHLADSLMLREALISRGVRISWETRMEEEISILLARPSFSPFPKAKTCFFSFFPRWLLAVVVNQSHKKWDGPGTTSKPMTSFKRRSERSTAGVVYAMGATLNPWKMRCFTNDLSFTRAPCMTFERSRKN